MGNIVTQYLYFYSSTAGYFTALIQCLGGCFCSERYKPDVTLRTILRWHTHTHTHTASPRVCIRVSVRSQRLDELTLLRFRRFLNGSVQTGSLAVVASGGVLSWCCGVVVLTLERDRTSGPTPDQWTLSGSTLTSVSSSISPPSSSSSSSVFPAANPRSSSPAAMAGGRAAVGLWVVLLLVQRCGAFNLDVDSPSVYSGPQGSYFGFSVDFFKPSDVLIGAPRANSSSSGGGVVERGAVYSCPWRSSSSCQQLQFDSSGAQMEFKSKQWFGASVRSDGEHILACAPLYQWSTFGVSEREPVGTCFLKKGGTVVEYSPCRSILLCSLKFFSVLLCSLTLSSSLCLSPGQLISDDVSEIFTRVDQGFITPYANTQATKSASAQYDDSYLGEHTRTHARTHAHTPHTHTHTHTHTDSGLLLYVVDLLVGAPLFMDRGSDGKLKEVGQVSVHLGRGGFSFHPAQVLTGSEKYARYGSAIAALGDLDRDGFNDVAISAPYGGPDHHGLVYIHNGRPQGPDPSPSQVLQGKWASSYMPASFGYSMTGNTDIDQNGYPDLIVGVFGADKAVLYRARPVVSVNATLDITPQIINPEEKACTVPGTSTMVSCFKVKYCLKASGPGAPQTLSFRVDLMLDRLKQKEATKRVLFLHGRTFQYSKNMMSGGKEGETDCRRNKITPISVVMEYSLDYKLAADRTGLQPIVDMSAPSNVTKQAHILLDCGDDNICKPDLRLSVKSNHQQIYIGDDNALTLEISAENQGEGAYETELHVYPPQQADFTGVGAVHSQTLNRLSCFYKKENQTKVVVCDLGNPMKGGTKVVAELRFSVHQLSEEDTSVKFDLQIVSSNQFNNTSPRVSSVTKLAVLATVSIRGTSSPSQVLLPIANWKPKEPPVVGDDIGPQIVHVYELLNNGPSTFSKASLEVEWPYQFKNGSLLYITSYETEGPINCTTDMEINPLNVSVKRETEGRNRNHVRKRDLESRDAQSDLHTLDCSTAECLRLRCQVGRLERRKNAILFIYSRLAVNNFLRTENQNRSYAVRSTASFTVIEMPYKNLEPELPSNSTTVSVSVVWVAEPVVPIPGWVVALAVLAGLLLLALLIFIMYKLGFFKRVRPPQEDCTEKEQLQPEENGNADA
uniref:Integrin, alpha V n=1 Tax=Sparus aurata TaxID=8175 RepID=A0A671V1X3_SPAAU